MRNILKELNLLFPTYILLLIIYPEIFGIFINAELFDLRMILIHLIWLPLFTIPYLLLRYNIFYYAAVIFYFISGLTNLVHWFYIHAPISASSLFILFSTNLQESIEFIDSKKNFYLLLLIVIPYMIIFILCLKQRLKTDLVKYNKIVVAITGLLSLIFIFENAYHQRLLRKGTPILLKAIISYYNESNAFKKNYFQTKNIQAKTKDTLSNQVYVLVIGESLNRNHMSIYGYSKNTTPLLKQRDDLIVYDNVVSPFSNTLESVLTALTSSNLNNKTDFSKSVSLIDVFKSAGFKTYWISNQAPIGVWDNLISSLAQTANVTKFVNLMSSSSFESTYAISYDEKVIPLFKQYLNEPAKQKIIFIHLMGSHLSYAKRYPDEYKKFNNFETEMNKTISEYDNSVYYNDFIINTIISTLKDYSLKNNSVSGLIYFSDHGENVYDEYNYAGHHYSDKMSVHHVEIPFLIWLSPNYISQYKNKYLTINKHKHHPFVTDNLFHAFIDFSNIQTNIFDSTRSVFNHHFNFAIKRILADGEDYDIKKMNYLKTKTTLINSYGVK